MSTRATEAESVLKEHMGYLPVSEMERRGVSRTEISRFVREAKLEKAAKGLYVSPNAESDPLFELQYRYPKAIFSHETALFLLGEGERAPPDTDDYPYRNHQVRLVSRMKTITVRKVPTIALQLAWRRLSPCSGIRFAFMIWNEPFAICSAPAAQWIRKICNPPSRIT